MREGKRDGNVLQANVLQLQYQYEKQEIDYISHLTCKLRTVVLSPLQASLSTHTTNQLVFMSRTNAKTYKWENVCFLLLIPL